jgi:hypothetical protein
LNISLSCSSIELAARLKRSGSWLILNSITHIPKKWYVNYLLWTLHTLGHQIYRL